MLIINVKNENSLNSALKTYRNKVRSTKQLTEIRRRKHYVKPSVQRRNEVLKAVHKSKKAEELDQ